MEAPAVGRRSSGRGRRRRLADDTADSRARQLEELLQREFTGGPVWIEALAYVLLLGIAVGWIWLEVWGLNRLLRAEVPTEVRGPTREPEPLRPEPTAEPVGGGRAQGLRT